MIRSFDIDKLKKASEAFNGPEFPYQTWLDNDKNYMFEEGDSVGLATYEYPGVYTVHWFFTVRGKEAKALAHEMLSEMFDKYDAKALRGVTPEELMGARILAKRLGFKSQGIMEFKKGPHEVMVLLKDDFKKEI